MRKNDELCRLLMLCRHGAHVTKRTAGRVHLAGRDGKAVRVADTIFADALRRRLVLLEKGRLGLSDDGVATLRRRIGEDEAGDGFAAQHRWLADETAEVAGERVPVTVNLLESPLAALSRLKGRDGRTFLDEDALLAGEKLRMDFTRAQLQPRISANWEAGVASGGARASNGMADLTDSALGARHRVERAINAVGPELSGVLLDICCFLKGLETVERERGWPVRSGKLMLRAALQSLSRHYGQRAPVKRL